MRTYLSQSLGSYLVLLLASSCLPAAYGVALDENDVQQTSTLKDDLFLKTLEIPPGWQSVMLATNPDVMDPTSLTIDEKGRVFIAETPRFRHGVEDNRNHLNWAKEDMAVQTLEDRLRIYEKYAPSIKGGMKYFTEFGERVRVLEQKNGKWSSKVFAGGFNDPLDGTAGGVFAFKGDIWFSSIPSVWRLRDTTGSGVADKREAVHRGFGIGTSISGHDLNGFAMGLDGRLYFSVGDRGYNFTSSEGKHFYSPTSGAVFRMEMDGSHLEVVHHGLRNPKEVAFDRFGNLFSVDNNADLGDRSRIVQILEGGESGWDRGHQSLSTFRAVWEHPEQNKNLWMAESWWNIQATNRPAAILPPSALYGQGPSGLSYFPGTGFGAKWDNAFLLADFTGRGEVKAFRMKPSGAGFALDFQENVLRGMDAPDIEFGYDGRLYVVDMKNGYMSKNDGRLLAFSDPAENQKPVVAEVETLFRNGIETLPSVRLGELLAHQDMRVRLRAEWELASRPEARKLFTAATAVGEPALKRLHATYGLGFLARRKHDALALERVTALTADPDPIVRARAAEIVGELASMNPKAFQALSTLMSDSDLHVRMLASIAIGKTGDDHARELLVQVLEKNADQDAFLRHGAVMGLFELGSPEKLKALVTHPSVAVRRAVLLTLRRFKSKEVAAFLADSDPSLVREAIQAIHDERIVEAYPSIAQRTDCFGKFGAAVDNRILCARLLGGRDEDFLALLDVAAQKQNSQDVRLEALWLMRNWEKPLGLNPVSGSFDLALNASHRTISEKVKPALSQRLATLATESGGGLLSDVLDTLEVFKVVLPEANKKAIFVNRANTVEARLRVMKSMGASPDLIKIGLEDPSLDLRMLALGWLASSDEAAAMKWAERRLSEGPIRERQAIIAMLGELKSPASAQKLKGLLGKVRELPTEIQTDVFAAAALRPECADLVVKAQAVAKADPDSLAAFRSALKGGDPTRGRNLFYNSPTAMCSRCHSAEAKVAGGHAGPPLMGVQAKGDEYLLRSVVEPSAEFAPGYAPMAVTLKNGQTVVGVLWERNPKATKIKLANGKLETIPADTIASATAPVSPMPPMAQLLSLMEIRDVVSFLKTLTPENNVALEAKKTTPEQVVKNAARPLD